MNLDAELERLAHRIRGVQETRSQQFADRDSIRQAIAEHGGDRIESIKREIGAKQTQKDERARRAGQYETRAKPLGLPSATDGEIFLSNQHAIREAREQAETAQAEAQNALTEASVELRQMQEQYDELAAELESLSRRRSNLGGRWSRRLNGWSRSGVSWKKDRTFCERSSGSLAIWKPP